MNLKKQEIEFINEIKQKVRKSQYDALKAVNVELINLYWEIGKGIYDKQTLEWGKSIVISLSNELQKEFPGIKGFSKSNLNYMAQFYKEYHEIENLQPLVGEISWTKHITIMQKCKDNNERRFYILATKKFGWTKNVLIHQIEGKSFEKFLLNQNNFDKNISDKVKNRAYLAVKDEYNFDFLSLSKEYSEKELEEGLIKNIRSFLIEMGNQFAFIGNQYKLQVEDNEYFIDLLLYHRQLKSLVAIEIKVGRFIPEYKGKMEFYLAVLNDTVKLPHENDSIGIIICKEKNRTIVEYSLKSSNMPIGVSSYQTTKELPKDYQNILPTEKELKEKISIFFENNLK